MVFIPVGSYTEYGLCTCFTIIARGQTQNNALEIVVPSLKWILFVTALQKTPYFIAQMSGTQKIIARVQLYCFLHAFEKTKNRSEKDNTGHRLA